MTHRVGVLGVVWALASLGAVTGCGADSDSSTESSPTATVTATVTETVSVAPEPTESAETSSVPPPTSAATGDASSAVLGPWEAPTELGLSVVAQGWQADGDITYGGVVVYNNGPMLGSLDVGVQAKVGGSVADSTSDSRLYVPADAFIVLEMAFLDLAPGATFEVVELKGDPQHFESFDLASGGITVTAELPRTRNDYGNVPITLTNPEPDQLPSSANVHVLVLDSNDRIISSSNSYTSLAVPPGESASDVVSDVWIPAGAASVVASVDHLSYGDES